MKKKLLQTMTGVNLLVAIGVVNILATAWQWGQIDLTTNRAHTLSGPTIDLVRNLDDVVRVNMYLTGDLPAQIKPLATSLRQTVTDLERINPGRFKVSYYDPNKDSQAKEDAEKYGIQPLQFSVIRADKFEVQSGYIGLVLNYGQKQEVLPMAGDVGNIEYLLVSGIKKLISKELPTVAISEGIGTNEQSGILYLRKFLETNYNVVEVNLNDNSPLPPKASSLVIVGQKEVIGAKGLAKIEGWIKDNKGLITFLDKIAVSPNLSAEKLPATGLEAIYEKYGIRINTGLVRDESGAVANFQSQQGTFLVKYPYWPEVKVEGINTNLPLTSGINSLALAWASPLEIDGQAIALIESGPLADIDEELKSLSPNLKWNQSTQKSKKILGAMNLEGVKIALIGDVEMISDQFVTNNQQNLLLALNMVDYFSQDSTFLQIRTKMVGSYPLRTVDEKTKSGVKLLNLALPLVMLLPWYGLFYWWRKRQNERWLVS